MLDAGTGGSGRKASAGGDGGGNSNWGGGDGAWVGGDGGSRNASGFQSLGSLEGGVAPRRRGLAASAAWSASRSRTTRCQTRNAAFAAGALPSRSATP